MRALAAGALATGLAATVIPAALAGSSAGAAEVQGRAEVGRLLAGMPTAFRQSSAIARSLDAGLNAQAVVPRAPRPPGLSIAEYGLPPGTVPLDIKNGPDGAVWFSAVHAMGRIDPITKQIQIFPAPAVAGVPYAVNGGPGPWMYFTSLGGNRAAGNDIGRINVYDHHYELFTIPTPAAYPADLKTGSDANIWFTEAMAGKVGRFDTRTNTVSEYDVGPGTLPQGVATGEGSCLVFRQCGASGTTGVDLPAGPLADGNVWVALMGPTPAGTPTSRLGLPGLPATPGLPAAPVATGPRAGAGSLLVLDPRNPSTTTRVPFPTPAAGVLDDDPGLTNRQVWFPEIAADRIGTVDVVQRRPVDFPLPTPGAVPFTIGPGPKARGPMMFWTEIGADSIGVLDSRAGAPRLYELPVLTPSAGFVDLTQNSRSNTVFFTEAAGDHIGEVVFSGSTGGGG